ncbi:MAG: hypothetical protein QNJ12_16985 [Ilumatobacter sp.]|uniref:hypothetical protein n=1 Tax=Ilumatobacter sp. TaxID=1967498 RepID=UPI002609B3C4|nr:hypothetical protein [Ilumatobacter sp.]MDJ0770491.1 hypothetical protein [Ilumatobacter sp.]
MIDLRLSVSFQTDQLSDCELDRLFEVLEGPGLRRVGTEVLKAVAPRRKLDTMSIYGVQRLGANKIRFFRGREHDEALAYREQLRSQGNLRLTSAGFGIRPSDRAEQIVSCDAALQVRPDGGSSMPLAFRASWTFWGEAWREWAPAASDALFDLFVEVAEAAELISGLATWADDPNETYNYAANLWRDRGSEPFVPGYRTMVFLPPEAAARLGGSERVVSEAPVERVSVLDRGGVVAMLCHSPDQLTENALSSWRDFLLPVVTLPDFEHARSTWTPTTPTRRPLDVLASDWPHDD